MSGGTSIGVARRRLPAGALRARLAARPPAAGLLVPAASIPGLTIRDRHHRFTRHLPALFHLVAATFGLLPGRLHLTRNEECQS